jgi:hypothetical protein
MTQSRGCTKTDRGPPPLLFSKEHTKSTKEKLFFKLRFLLLYLIFVTFATFVVRKCF